MPINAFTMLFPNAVFVLAALVVLLLNGFVTFALALALLNGVVA
jgi:hypothetical protein